MPYYLQSKTLQTKMSLKKELVKHIMFYALCYIIDWSITD